MRHGIIYLLIFVMTVGHYVTWVESSAHAENQIKIANDNQEEQGFSVEKGKADEVGIPISEQVNDDQEHEEKEHTEGSIDRKEESKDKNKDITDSRNETEVEEGEAFETVIEEEKGTGEEEKELNDGSEVIEKETVGDVDSDERVDGERGANEGDGEETVEVGTGSEQAFVETPDLMITEIVARSAGAGQPYEFIEIYNNTSSDMNLDGYELHYFTNNFNNPANRWPIQGTTVKAKSVHVIWLKKFNDPTVPLWDFNSNYETLLKAEQVFQLPLTTAAQGLADTATRKVAIANENGELVSSAVYNDGVLDGILNRSVIYTSTSADIEMEWLTNDQVPTPGTLVSEQIPGPTSPGNVRGVAGDAQINLSWDESGSAAVGYHLYDGEGSEPIFIEGTEAVIESLTNGSSYEYRVTAIDAVGNESPSSEVVTVVPHTPLDLESPAAPTNVRAKPGVGIVRLQWEENKEEDLAAYRIYVDGTLYEEVSKETLQSTVTPLVLGRQYTFSISAVDRVGNESALTEITAGPYEELPVPELLITELVPQTHNYLGYNAFEYIEIYNNSAEPIDLKGYRVRSFNWDYEITESFIIQPWDTMLFWPRRGEVQPITIEAFNHYYLLSDESKYLDDNRMLIIDNVGGLVNTNEQTVSIIDPYGIEQTVAHYSGQDVSRLRSIKYQYPDDGTNEMEKVEAHARPTPGWLDPGQVPERPQYHTNQPAAPTGIQVQELGGKAQISWQANSEEDMFRYHIYQDGEWQYSVPAAQLDYTLAALTGHVEYVVELVAEDESGNISEKSTPLIVQVNHQTIVQKEREKHSRNPEFDYLWDISEDGPVIPGLGEELIPQGLSYAKDQDWLLSVYYLDDKRPSTLTVVDASTEKLVKSVLLYHEDGLPYNGHAGGIAVSGEHVWIASEMSLYQLKLEDLVQANDNDHVYFINQIPLPVQAAYNVVHDGVMWVGEFYEANDYPTNPEHHLENRDGEMYYAWMVGFPLDPETDGIDEAYWEGPGHEADPAYIVSTREKVQGVTFVDGELIVSTSYGRANASYLYRYHTPLEDEPHTTVEMNEREIPVWFLDSKQEPEENSHLRIIPMSEGLIHVDNQLYVTFESGANKYRFTTTYVIDRMLKIDLAAWAGLPPHVEMLLEEDEAAPAEREGPLGEMVEPARETGDPLEHLSRDEVE